MVYPYSFVDSVYSHSTLDLFHVISDDTETVIFVQVISCTVCPAGYRCPVKGALPLPCETGEYSLGAAYLSCLGCDAGSQCVDKASSPQSCLSGEYSPQNVSVCIDCPAGYNCTLPADDLTECDDGYYSTAGQHGCDVCPSG